MALIDWSEKLSVGVEVFDQDHRKLVGLINQLHEALKVGQGMHTLSSIFEELVTYTSTHFAREESYMQTHAFPGLVAHAREHASLTTQVLELQARFRAGSSAALTLDVMVFLRDWLTHHIRATDKALGAFLNSRGVR